MGLFRRLNARNPGRGQHVALGDLVLAHQFHRRRRHANLPTRHRRPPLRPRMIARTRPVTAAGCLRSALDMLQVGVNL